jgi:hypothetical protein
MLILSDVLCVQCYGGHASVPQTHQRLERVCSGSGTPLLVPGSQLATAMDGRQIEDRYTTSENILWDTANLLGILGEDLKAGGGSHLLFP